MFTNLGRAGGCPSQSEATSRLLSTGLRAGISPEALVEQLRGIRCLSTVRQMEKEKIRVLSCPDAIGRVLTKAIQMQKDTYGGQFFADTICTSEDKDMGPGSSLPKYCPECGNPMEHEGGCAICRNCGYSKCG